MSSARREILKTGLFGVYIGYFLSRFIWTRERVFLIGKDQSEDVGVQYNPDVCWELLSRMGHADWVMFYRKTKSKSNVNLFMMRQHIAG